jgi:hypothetical protein
MSQIWVKIEKSFQRFVNFSSENNEFWWAVTSPHMGHAKQLTMHWHSKGHKPKVIYPKLESPLGHSTPRYPYPTVTDWCRKLKRKFNILVTARGPGEPLDCDLDDIIFPALNEFPFHCLRSLSRTIKRPMSTIRDHLPRAGFVLKPLKWVAHRSSAEHKKTRVELVGQILQHLSLARYQHWNYF